MPDHCIPRNFEWEREQPWGGGPIMNDTERPVSFFVRGSMLRKSPPDDSSSETVNIEPRSLPEPRRKTPPPPPLYRPKMPQTTLDISLIDPSKIIEIDGNKYWFRNGHISGVPGFCKPEPRLALPKLPLAEPISGLSKPARGRHVPKKGASTDSNRKYCCPVADCRKLFTKRDHLNRHIQSLHQHEKTYTCAIPNCDKSFTREDNYNRHWRKHQAQYQEIIACSPEDDYKGVHLQNPHVLDPDCYDIKPYANIAISTLALDLWRYQERQRERGSDIPLHSDCDKYFAAHPEERDAALNGDPKWDWKMPPPGDEFTPYKPHDPRSLYGQFRLNVKSDTTP